MYAVLGLLAVMVIIYFLTKPSTEKKLEKEKDAKTQKEKREGFQDSPKDDKLIVPPTIKPPPPVVDTDPQPSQLPGKLPAGPYQQIARNSALPYQDPALTKASKESILTTLEMLKGFLAFQANEIEYRSDPSIQLPLTTARGDFQRLSDEANVLARNPGLQSSLTNKDINEMSDNLAYLQREVGLIGANRPFVNRSLERLTNVEGFENQATGTTAETSKALATEDDLKDFSAKIQGEILRLSASGTIDPVTNARISNLTKMKNDVDNVITKLQNGSMLSSEVPIFKADIDKALPILGNPSEPLPQILQTLNLPSGLANALGPMAPGDGEQNREVLATLSKYLSTFFEGTSARVSVDLKYTSPSEIKVAEARKGCKDSKIDQIGFPSIGDLNSVAGSGIETADGSMYGSAVDLPDVMGAFLNGNNQNQSSNIKQKVTDRYAADPRAEGRSPAHFDWKERTRHIENQIRQRGIKDKDVGLMPPEAKVSNDFNWKGYAKMICTRLQANVDTGLPVACGCPPADWKGW